MVNDLRDFAKFVNFKLSKPKYLLIYSLSVSTHNHSTLCFVMNETVVFWIYCAEVFSLLLLKKVIILLGSR